MTFKELQEIFELKFGIATLADIARELDVTPQVVSNWKSRNQIPYKYVIKLKKKLDSNIFDKSSVKKDSFGIPQSENIENEKNYIETLALIVRSIILLIAKELKLIITIIFIICSIGLIKLQFFTTSVYSSSAKVLPLLRQSGNVLNLVNSLGFGSPAGASSSGQFPNAAIIPDVIKSKLLHEKLLFEKFNYNTNDSTTYLINILIGSPENTKAYNNAELQSALKKLKKLIFSYSPRNTSIITIGARTSDPVLSKELVSKIIEHLEIIFSEHKIQLAKDKRLFVESRMLELGKELSEAENDLKVFSEKNRIIINSPALILERSRLERVVQGKMQILVNLRTDYEVTKIEELERKKLLLVLDEPAIPTIRQSPRKTKTMIILIIVSTSISILAAFIKNWFKENYTLYIAPVFKNM